MTPDEQEALSRCFSGFWCLPLRSGRIAVWDHPARSLRCIVDSWQEVTMLPNYTPPPPKQLNLPDIGDIDL